MWTDGRRIAGLGSLLVGAAACGLIGAFVARYALVGFGGEQGPVAGVAVAGLGLTGIGCLRRGLRGLRCESFGRLG